MRRALVVLRVRRAHLDRPDRDRLPFVDLDHALEAEPLDGMRETPRDDRGRTAVEPAEGRQVEVVAVRVRDEERVRAAQRLEVDRRSPVQVQHPATKQRIGQEPDAVELDRGPSSDRRRGRCSLARVCATRGLLASPWARRRTGSARSGARHSATGSRSAVTCGFAQRYFDESEGELPAECPQCGGEIRSRCPECDARFSSAFAVECEVCGAELRPPTAFGGPIRKPGR